MQTIGQTLGISALAALTVAVYAAMHTIAKTQAGIPPFAFIAIAMGTVAIMGGIASLYMDEGALSGAVKWSQVGMLVFYAAVNFIGFVLYLYCIARMPVMQYQLISLVGPVFGGLIAFAVLSEPLAPRFLAALPFLGFGVWLALSK